MSADDEHRARVHYDEVADRYADAYSGTEPEQPIELAMIDHFVGLLPEPRRVLDAGCGTGRMLPELARRGCRPEGVDLSEQMVRRARQDHPDFPVTVGSLTALEVPDDGFDGVFSWYSTIHNPDADLPVMLSEMARVVRPGGYVLIAFQAGDQTRAVGGSSAQLTRHARSLATMQQATANAGLVTVCSMERAAVAGERDAQAVLICRRPAGAPD